MNRQLKLAAVLIGGAFAAGCSSGMSQDQIEQEMAVRDARCQDLKRKIDAAEGKPLQRDYLLRQYDRECRRP